MPTLDSDSNEEDAINEIEREAKEVNPQEALIPPQDPPAPS